MEMRHSLNLTQKQGLIITQRLQQGGAFAIGQFYVEQRQIEIPGRQFFPHEIEIFPHKVKIEHKT